MQDLSGPIDDGEVVDGRWRVVCNEAPLESSPRFDRRQRREFHVTKLLAQKLVRQTQNGTHRVPTIGLPALQNIIGTTYQNSATGFFQQAEALLGSKKTFPTTK